MLVSNSAFWMTVINLEFPESCCGIAMTMIKHANIMIKNVQIKQDVTLENARFATVSDASVFNQHQSHVMVLGAIVKF